MTQDRDGGPAREAATALDALTAERDALLARAEAAEADVKAVLWDFLPGNFDDKPHRAFSTLRKIAERYGEPNAAKQLDALYERIGPMLAAEARESRLREALEFYANEANWGFEELAYSAPQCAIYNDHGSIAQDAIDAALTPEPTDV